MTFEHIDFDLVEVIKNTIDLLSTAASGKGLELSYIIGEGTATHLMCDPTRLRQVLLNLLNNAIKFTERGKVQLEIVQTMDVNQEVKLSFRVHDSGIGISEEAQAKLFRSFTQADTTTTRKYGGTGLGLAICDKLVELMGGTIEVKSALGKGSTFTFALQFEKQKSRVWTKGTPIPGPERSHYTLTTAPEVSLDSSRVLLVEDGRTNQMVGIQILRKLGYTADIAVDGAEAVEAWRRNKYDIILMDCHMPEMDGFEATRKIRELEAEQSLKPTKIIAMTASTLPEDRKSCMAAGMNDYTTKPVDQKTLRAALTKAIGLTQ